MPAVAVDNGEADKADAADHLRRDPGGVGAPVAGEEKAVHREVGEGVFGDDHDKGGGAAHKAVGADAGLLQALGAVIADGAAAEGGDQHADEEGELIAQRGGFVHAGK